MKTTLPIATLTVALAFGAGAQRESTPVPQDRIVTAEASRTNPGNNKNAEDVEFMLDALRTSLAEVQMGELATQRSSDTRVRDYGARIQSEHSAQAAELERLLEPLAVTIPAEPSAEAQLQHTALARLSGEQFDAAFIDAMIASHKEALEEYGAQTHANPDRALADFASKGVTMLREHLAAAEALRAKPASL
jgi:putative membrane protein